MTDTDSVIAAIESDPSRFDEHVGGLRTILESGETDARRSVAQLLGDVAEVDPQIGTRHPELLELAFEDENNIVRGSAVHAVAIIAGAIPEAVTDFVPHLATALADEEVVGSAPISGINALAIIDRDTTVSISEADEALAELLHDTDGIVRETVVENIADTVTAAPREFPALLRAYVPALDDRRPKVRLHAAEVLTVVAYEDVEALTDVDEVLDRLRELRSDDALPTERVEKMIDMTRVGAGYAEE